MKKVISILALGSVLVSCSKKEEVAESNNNVMLEETTASTAGETEVTGQSLIDNADCRSCHQDDAKLVGPAYQDIANKYTEADLDMLADKIINGSSGVWGPVPMSPHPGLSKENAKKMAEYILSMKK
ncbi:cytochrome c domain protein [Bergeyella porcorum]|uniref:Cytochrome c domain protein n=1 Tax=Bergeyella porcorum TaxID=1735111 RepID=A0AAU0EZV9_9FLAO